VRRFGCCHFSRKEISHFRALVELNGEPEVPDTSSTKSPTPSPGPQPVTPGNGSGSRGPSGVQAGAAVLPPAPSNRLPNSCCVAILADAPRRGSGHRAGQWPAALAAPALPANPHEEHALTARRRGEASDIIHAEGVRGDGHHPGRRRVKWSMPGRGSLEPGERGRGGCLVRG
jgi:hypothetical protein